MARPTKRVIAENHKDKVKIQENRYRFLRGFNIDLELTTLRSVRRGLESQIFDINVSIIALENLSRERNPSILAQA